MQINPRDAIDNGWLLPVEGTEVQQVGIDLTLGEDIELCAGESYNVLLQERFKLPGDVFSTLHTRSSFSRKGIFVTAGVYDPGYGDKNEDGSPAGCTIYNFSGDSIVVEKGTRILQAVFYKADSASDYDGHYGRTDSVSSKL